MATAPLQGGEAGIDRTRSPFITHGLRRPLHLVIIQSLVLRCQEDGIRRAQQHRRPTIARLAAIVVDATHALAHASRRLESFVLVDSIPGEGYDTSISLGSLFIRRCSSIRGLGRTIVLQRCVGCTLHQNFLWKSYMSPPNIERQSSKSKLLISQSGRANGCTRTFCGIFNLQQR